MVFAGPVFTEWYWGPLFFVLLFGLPLLVAALVADLAVRRWVAPLRGLRRAGLWAAVLAGGTLAILGGQRLIDHLRFEREAKAAALTFDFTPYAPGELPAGFSERGVNAVDSLAPVLYRHYEAGPGGRALSDQQRAIDVSLTDGRCDLHRLAASSSSFFEGPCRERRTASGRRVYVGASSRLLRGEIAFALLDGTLVRLESVGVAEPDVLAYFDSLRPVQPAEIDFKGP